MPDAHDPADAGRAGRSDADLLAAAAAGDPDAFAHLYHRHKDWAFRVALRFSAGEADAADAVQESFIYLLRKLPTLTLSARFTTFLYPVLKHTALAARRRPRARSLDAPLHDRLDSPPQALTDHHAPALGGRAAASGPARAGDPASAGALDDLRRLLEALDGPHREVVILRFVDGFSLEQIAAATAVPLGTVKSRLHHALAKLRADPAWRRHFTDEAG